MITWRNGLAPESAKTALLVDPMKRKEVATELKDEADIVKEKRKAAEEARLSRAQQGKKNSE